MAKRAAASKAAAVTPGQVLDLVPERDEDLELVEQTGSAIRLFIGGLAEFFTRAKTLETRAIATLEESKALTIPTTAEEDERLQRFVKRTTAEKKEVEEHWSITAKVSAFHKRLTARRAKATDALEAANLKGNTLHNNYVAAERRRAAEEQERLRRQAEENARLERERELAAAEAEAVKREEASADLSAREQIYVGLILAGANAQAAATRAGFKEPLKAAARLSSSRKIQAAVQAGREAKMIREQAAARAADPIEYEVDEVKPNVVQAAGAFDRSTHSAELLDEQALVAAILEGKLGIPTDLLRIDPARLNGYARDLQVLINKWPGVRYKKTTRVV